MPVVNVNLLVDEKTDAGVKSGVLELCGLAKNIDNKRVAKHLPAVADAAKDDVSKAIDVIRAHKKGTLIFGGILIAGGAAAGTVSYITHRNKRKLEKQFGNALQNYLDSAKNGLLTIDVLESLLNSIDELEKKTPDKQINLNVSSSQFGELINCIFDYTKRLAEANQLNPQNINRPKVFKEKTTDDLKYYLKMQKQILEQVA